MILRSCVYLVQKRANFTFIWAFSAYVVLNIRTAGYPGTVLEGGQWYLKSGDVECTYNSHTEYVSLLAKWVNHNSYACLEKVSKFRKRMNTLLIRKLVP